MLISARVQGETVFTRFFLAKLSRKQKWIPRNNGRTLLRQQQRMQVVLFYSCEKSS